MSDRLRCAECVGHIAYECDKRFDEAVPIELFYEALDERPTPEHHTEHMGYWRKSHAEDVQEELCDALGCELTAEEVRLSLYGAVQEFRDTDPERAEALKQDLGELFDEHLRRLQERE